MDEKEVLHRLDELDADLTGVNAMTVGAHWPTTALACAMLDKALIDKTALLKIIDSLMMTASAFAVTTETDPAYTAFTLERFRRDIEQMELKAGNVLKELEEIEIGAAEQARRYQEILDREQGSKGPD